MLRRIYKYASVLYQLINSATIIIIIIHIYFISELMLPFVDHNWNTCYHLVTEHMVPMLPHT